MGQTNWGGRRNIEQEVSLGLGLDWNADNTSQEIHWSTLGLDIAIVRCHR